MSANTATRIEQRNAAAAQHMQGQGFIQRAVSKSGLAVANTVDRSTGWVRNDRVIFGSATLFGLVTGGIRGAGIAMIAAIYMGLLGTYTPFIGGLLLAGAMGASAIYYGIKEGQTLLEKHQAAKQWRLPNAIAHASGAIGKTDPNPTLPEPKKAEKPDFVARLFEERVRKLNRGHRR